MKTLADNWKCSYLADVWQDLRGLLKYLCDSGFAGLIRDLNSKPDIWIVCVCRGEGGRGVKQGSPPEG